LLTTKRALCARCTRPQAACICRWAAATDTRVHLLILQHPMEVNNAKGSARLLHLGVANSTLAVGEAFEPSLLQAMLHAGGRSPILLYPDTADMACAPLEPSLLGAPDKLRLVVLDGTWRKSRKMLYQNRLLQNLPRLPLTQMPASHYLIRKAHAPDQLSTLEASCHALAQLDGAACFQPLLDGFDDFVATFQATGGRLAQ